MKDWRREEKGTTENEMVGWHHQLNGHEFEWIPGVGDGQGGLACCSPWSRKESDATELNWSNFYLIFLQNCLTTHGLLLFHRTFRINFFKWYWIFLSMNIAYLHLISFPFVSTVFCNFLYKGFSCLFLALFLSYLLFFVAIIIVIFSLTYSNLFLLKYI